MKDLNDQRGQSLRTLCRMIVQIRSDSYRWQEIHGLLPADTPPVHREIYSSWVNFCWRSHDLPSYAKHYQLTRPQLAAAHESPSFPRHLGIEARELLAGVEAPLTTFKNVSKSSRPPEFITFCMASSDIYPLGVPPPVVCNTGKNSTICDADNG